MTDAQNHDERTLEQMKQDYLAAAGEGVVTILPSEPMPDVRGLQYRELTNALAYLSHAQWHYERGEDEDGRMWLDDARRSLGALALLLAEGPDVEGYARLLMTVLEPKAQGGRG